MKASMTSPSSRSTTRFSFWAFDGGRKQQIAARHLLLGRDLFIYSIFRLERLV
jgi:hypothetical protein